MHTFYFHAAAFAKSASFFKKEPHRGSFFAMGEIVLTLK